MIYTKTVEHELYVYRNGRLIYKRWINHNYSLVFDVMAYGKNTLKSITDGKGSR